MSTKYLIGVERAAYIIDNNANIYVYPFNDSDRYRGRWVDENVVYYMYQRNDGQAIMIAEINAQKTLATVGSFPWTEPTEPTDDHVYNLLNAVHQYSPQLTNNEPVQVVPVDYEPQHGGF